ncbi:hypothetical protein D9M72_529050 [compost metagenome]
MAAEADAEHRALAVAEATHQRCKLRQVGESLVVERVLLATEHHERVEAVGCLRNRVAGIGAANLDLRLDLAKRRADLAELGLRHVFHHQYPHQNLPFAVSAED